MISATLAAGCGDEADETTQNAPPTSAQEEATGSQIADALGVEDVHADDPTELPEGEESSAFGQINGVFVEVSVFESAYAMADDAEKAERGGSAVYRCPGGVLVSANERVKGLETALKKELGGC